MDPAALAATATAFLAPYLAKAGGAILDNAAAAIPGAVGDLATRLWAAITQRFEGNPAASGAAEQLASNAADEDRQAAFELQLKMALKENRDFAESVLALVKQAQAASPDLGGTSIQTGDVSHSAIVAGDGNTVTNS